MVMRRRRGLRALAPASPVEELPAPSTGAWPGWREFRVARREFEDRAHTQCSFYLEPVDGSLLPPFAPGQFLTFSLHVADSLAPQVDVSRSITRCYSLSDRPHPKHFRVTIKRVPAPLDRPDVPAGASSSHFHDHVQQGDVLKLKAPAGHFFIDPDASVPAVLIAGGIGITPMMSMLRWCLAEQPDPHAASVLRCAQWWRACVQGPAGAACRAAWQRPPERRLQPSAGRRRGGARLPARGTRRYRVAASHACRTAGTSSTSAGRRH